MRLASAKTIVVTLLAMLAMGCGSVARSPHPQTVVQPKGAVPIMYLYGEGDRENPPRGFYVRRSAVPSGPFDRINPAPIPAAAEPDFSRPAVIYRDGGLAVGSTWYYFLEVIDAQGRVRKATPVVSARVLLPNVDASGRPVRPVQEGSRTK